MENLFVEGTWNSKFADEVKPSESDIILKNRVNFSAFKGTALKDIIESNGIYLYVENSRDAVRGNASSDDPVQSATTMTRKTQSCT